MDSTAEVTDLGYSSNVCSTPRNVHSRLSTSEIAFALQARN
jgi:hypothetical protein